MIKYSELTKRFYFLPVKGAKVDITDEINQILLHAYNPNQQPEQYPTPQEQQTFRVKEDGRELFFYGSKPTEFEKWKKERDKHETFLEWCEMNCNHVPESQPAVQGDIVQDNWNIEKDKPAVVRINEFLRIEFVVEMENVKTMEDFDKFTKHGGAEILANKIASLPSLLRENKELQKSVKYAEKVGYETSVENANFISKNQQQAKDIEELSCFISDLYRRLYETMGRVGGSSSFGDTFHVMYDDKMSIGDKMAELMGKHKK